MRAAVAQPDQRVRALHHLAAAVEVVGGVVGEGCEDEVFALAFDQVVVHDLARIAVLAARACAQRAFLRRLVVRRIAQREHAIEVGETRRHGRAQRFLALLQDLRAECGIAHDRQTFRDRLVLDRLVGGAHRERDAARLQTLQDADRARRHLRLGAMALGDQALDQPEQSAPAVRPRVGLRQRHREWPA